MEEKITITSREYFKTIKIIHIAMIMGIIFFGIVAIFNQSSLGFPIYEQITKIYLILVLVFVVFGIIASNMIYKKKLVKIKEKTSLKEKLEEYRGALIIKFALVEGPAFLLILVFLITGKYFLLGLAALMVGILVFYSPSIEKAINEIELSENEAKILENPDAEIN